MNASEKSVSLTSKQSAFHRPVNFYYAVLIITLVGSVIAFWLLKRMPEQGVFIPQLPANSGTTFIAPVAAVGIVKDCSDVQAGLPIKGACYLDFENGTKITIVYTGHSEGQYTYKGKVHAIDGDNIDMFEPIYSRDNSLDSVEVPTTTSDFNYDGVPDVQSAIHEGNGEDPGMDIFSFNTKTGEFDPIISLSADADIDLAHKQIHEGGRDSCCETETDDLAWVNGAWITTELDTDEMSDSGERFVTYDYNLLRSSVAPFATPNDIEDMGPTDVVVDSDSSDADSSVSDNDLSDSSGFFSCDPPTYLATLYNIYMYHLPSTDSANIMHDAFLSIGPECATVSSSGLFYTGQWKEPVPTDGSIFSDQIQGNYFIRLLSLNPQAVLKEYDASSADTQKEFQAVLANSYLDLQGKQFLALAITALDPIQSASSAKISAILKKL